MTINFCKTDPKLDASKSYERLQRIVFEKESLTKVTFSKKAELDALINFIMN